MGGEKRHRNLCQRKYDEGWGTLSEKKLEGDDAIRECRGGKMKNGHEYGKWLRLTTLIVNLLAPGVTGAVVNKERSRDVTLSPRMVGGWRIKRRDKHWSQRDEGVLQWGGGF